ncbi:putative membrane protein YccC [Rhodoligotrophos appendicifer]|uniref:FUSC family protein n=1 Tax=Rhodoligotrophos appendicifer TaxID=987056 RepID=UPI001185D9BC|nr:FUSC family protein [Rhodoligotrophos appendicifer]
MAAKAEFAREVAWIGAFLSAPFTLQNLIFSLKTFAAAILALVCSYWLEVKEPQWSIITVYLLAQPLLGAVWAKGAYRLIGTGCGAAFAILALGLFAQSGPLFLGTMAVWLAACAYFATLARNFASYGFALAAYSALLVGFGSAAQPDQAWNLAVDRITEVSLGIVCVGLVSALIFPRYASDSLRASMQVLFSSLAHYASMTLKADTPAEAFAQTRRKMAADVIKFDALRSYAVFETPELQTLEEPLSRMMRAFLGLLSVARGLFVRLADLRCHEDRKMASHLDPTLEEISALLESIAGDPMGPHGAGAQAALDRCRSIIAEARSNLESMAGIAPLDPLADALLVIERTGDMVESLARVVAAATGAPTAQASVPLIVAAIERNKRAALLQAARAAAAPSLIGVFWIATAWTAGAMAMTGLAVMMVFFVTAENPGRLALSFVAAVAAAVVLAFFGMAFILPSLDDFVMLASLLGIVLIPAGLFMSIPQYAFVAAVFSAFFSSQLGLTNVPSFDVSQYIDNSTGLLLGMSGGVLAINLILPYNPQVSRKREWQRVVASLPAAARGERPEYGARLPIFIPLLELMPRLDLTNPADDEILGASFGAASMSLEMIRLKARAADVTLPSSARAAVEKCLDNLAVGFEELLRAQSTESRESLVDDASRSVTSAYGELAASPMDVGAQQTISLAHVLASMRFMLDRLNTDRRFLTQTLS